MQPEIRVRRFSELHVSSRLDFEGMWAGGAAAGGAGVGGGTNKMHMRRRQREAERAKRAQLAGEIDGRSRCGRELGAAAAHLDSDPAQSCLTFDRHRP